MGSDSFESKRFGGAPSGGAPAGRAAQPDFSGDVDLGNLPGEGPATGLVELRGLIKWFDASKGYGFIVPDNGWPDILLHVTVLQLRDDVLDAAPGLLMALVNSGT